MKNKIQFTSAFETYTTQAVRGEGGSGRVYEVTDSDNAPWALKTLKPENLDSKRLRRFKNEISFCQKTEHPNIVPVCDFGTSTINGKTVPFYVMPLFDRTLRNMVPFSDGKKALNTFGQILNGVEAAHLLDVWHRDLKPENILYSNVAIVADFGIAHFSEHILYTIVQTQESDRLANFKYAAPEQRQNQPTDQRTDLFSLGLILNEMFTGKIPQGTNYQTIGEVFPEYTYLDGIIEKLIAQTPSSRFQTIPELKKAISALGTQYLAEQKLLVAEKKVVFADTPDELPEFSIIDVNIIGRTLELKLNEAPPADWIRTLNAGMFGHRALPGHGPSNFQIQGDIARTGNINLNNTQQILDHFKSWVAMVSQMVEQQRRECAEREKRETQERTQSELREQRDRLETLKKLKF